jgi:hypothetical protein
MTTALAERAAAFRTKSQRVARNSEGAELAKHLRERYALIVTLTERFAALATMRKVVQSAVPAMRVPRVRLRQRVKGLEKLESAAAADIRKVTERDALDVEALNQAYGETATAILETWKKFAKPAGNMSFDVIESDPEAQRLSVLRQELETLGRQPPTSESTVERVDRLKAEIAEGIDRLLASGYDDAVLQFLANTRAGRGVALVDVLKNPPLLKWIQERAPGKNLRVVHEGVLRP